MLSTKKIEKILMQENLLNATKNSKFLINLSAKKKGKREEESTVTV